MANQVTAEIGLKDNFSQAVDSIKSSMQALNREFGLQEGGLAALGKSFRAHQKEIMNLEHQYQSLSSEAKNTQFGRDIAAQLAAIKAAAAEEKDSIADTKKEIANLSTDTPKLDIMTQSMGLLSSSMATAASVAGMFGSENERVAQIMRVTAVITQVLNMATSIYYATQREGLAGLIAGTFAHKAKTTAEQADTTALVANTAAETTNGIAKVGSTVKNAALSVSNVVAAGTTHLFTRAIQGLNAAFAANPIGFVLTAITSLLTIVMTAIGIFGSSSDAVDEESESMNANAEAARADADAKKQLSEDIRNNTAKNVAAYEDMKQAYLALRSEHEKTKWLEENKEKFKELGIAVFNTVDADDVFIGNTNNVIKALTLRAQATAYATYVQQKYANAMANIDNIKAGQRVSFKSPQQLEHFKRLGYVKEDGKWFSNGHIYDSGYVLTEKGAQQQRHTRGYNAFREFEREWAKKIKMENDAAKQLKDATQSGRSGRTYGGTTTGKSTTKGGSSTNRTTHTETEAEKQQKAWNDSVKKLEEENKRLDLLLKNGIINQREYNEKLLQLRENFLMSNVALAQGNAQRVAYYKSLYELYHSTKRGLEVQDTWDKAVEEYNNTIQELNAKYRDGLISVDEMNKSAVEASKTLRTKTATIADELSAKQQQERSGIADYGFNINIDAIIKQLIQGTNDLIEQKTYEYFQPTHEQALAQLYGTKADKKANPYGQVENNMRVITEEKLGKDSPYRRGVEDTSSVLTNILPKNLSFQEELSYYQELLKKTMDARGQVSDMYIEATKKITKEYDQELKPLQDKFSEYTNKAANAREKGNTKEADEYDKKADEYDSKVKKKKKELDDALQKTLEATDKIIDFLNFMSVKAVEHITGTKHVFGVTKDAKIVDTPYNDVPVYIDTGKKVKKAQNLIKATDTENTFKELAGSDLSSTYENIKKLKDTIDDMSEGGINLTNIADGFTAIGTAASSMGAALQALGASSTVAKVGLIAAAIGQVVLGFAMASKDAAKYGIWTWIAATAAGLATVLTTVAQIKQMNGGGIVGGSGISGDNNLVRLNTGEMVLNRNQQTRLLNLADGHNQGGISVGTVRVKGSDLYLALSNYGKIKGQTGKNLF